ncbi:MAG: TetR/AcrR family transcriptional regulator [Spirochaetes bacterium]|nr:TetR/AcrR family transcriptional regulator [Spirochaetota bacterium]
MTMSEANIQQTILVTFHRLAIERGLKKVTIDILAKECGISKKTVYKHFNNKKEILDRFTADVIARLSDEFYKTQLIEDNPEKLLLKFFDIIFETVQNLPPSIVTDAAHYYPDIAEKIIQLREQYTIVFLKIIKKGISQGQFRDINPLFLEGVYDAIVNRVFTPSFIVQNNLTVKDALSSFKTILLNGILRDGQENLPGDRR